MDRVRLPRGVPAGTVSLPGRPAVASLVGEGDGGGAVAPILTEGVTPVTGCVDHE